MKHKLCSFTEDDYDIAVLHGAITMNVEDN